MSIKCISNPSKSLNTRYCLLKITCLFKQSFSSNNISSTTKNLSQSISNNQLTIDPHINKLIFVNHNKFVKILNPNLRHYHKLASIHATNFFCLVSIYEHGMLKMCCDKKPTFENLDLLINHQIKGSRPLSFSTLNLRNKDNLALRRPLVASCVEVVNPNNLVEVGGSLGDEKTKPAS